MTWRTARIRSLDSATGLLYIVAALILAGEIAARTLFFLTGVDLSVTSRRRRPGDLILGLVPDPSELLHYMPDADATPLRAPHALVAFGGWVDAGSGGTGAVRHLITNLKSRKLAEMDSEEFYSFTDTRPLVSIVGAGERAVHWPRGEFHGATLEHDSDLVLFVAPEPNLKWPTFASVMLDGMQHFGVQSMVCIGSIFGAVPHRGDVRMTGWANDDQLREALAQHNVMFTNYEGPTGFVTVLLAEAEARGMPAVAVYGFAPNYIQGVPNPRVSHALLKTFSAHHRRAAAARRSRPRRPSAGAPGRSPAAGPAAAARAGRAHAQPDERSRAARRARRRVRSPARSTSRPARTSSCPARRPWSRELEEFLKQLRRQDPGTPDPTNERRALDSSPNVPFGLPSPGCRRRGRPAPWPPGRSAICCVARCRSSTASCASKA